jgi:hypothetical protein
MLILGMLIMPLAQVAVSREQKSRVGGILLSAYLLRIFLFLFVARSVSLFSHAAGFTDSAWYESVGRMIAQIWRVQGIHFFQDESVVFGIKKIALPCNLFALVLYVTGDSGGISVAGLVAFLACMVGLVVYRFALAVGASEGAAVRGMTMTLFGPSFLYYTSDTYKDGINALCVLTAVWLSVELGKSLSPRNFLFVVASLVAVYFVRPYMVFMCASPALIGFLGLRKGLTLRSVVTTLAVTAVALVGLAYSSIGAHIADEAMETFEHATSSGVVNGNATGGSGVTFSDGGNPFGQIHLKLLYTICSPFPWMGGSIGLQLGKIESLMFYYFIYSSYKASKLLLKRSTGTLVMLLSFLLPASVAYATTMANVGLIVRQRMPLVMVACVFATVYWTEEERRKATYKKAPARGVQRLGAQAPAPPEPAQEPAASPPGAGPAPGRSRVAPLSMKRRLS